jgi:hypothetical protein
VSKLGRKGEKEDGYGGGKGGDGRIEERKVLEERKRRQRGNAWVLVLGAGRKVNSTTIVGKGGGGEITAQKVVQE